MQENELCANAGVSSSRRSLLRRTAGNGPDRRRTPSNVVVTELTKKIETKLSVESYKLFQTSEWMLENRMESQKYNTMCMQEILFCNKNKRTEHSVAPMLLVILISKVDLYKKK